MIAGLLGLSAFSSGSSLLALLASRGEVFFIGNIVRRRRSADQTRVDTGEAELYLG